MSGPPPPADLARRAPALLPAPRGTSLHRFHDAAYDPIYFDRGLRGRLNAPDGGYGVLYLSQTPSGAFAETFLREPGRTLLPTDLVAAKAYARLRASRPLTFIQLFGLGLARLGATAEVTHGGLPYDTAQAWSAALHAHPVQADGIAYTARHDDTAVCLALFDRASNAVEADSRVDHLETHDWFWELAEPYNVGLAP